MFHIQPTTNQSKSTEHYEKILLFLSNEVLEWRFGYQAPCYNMVW